MIAASHLPPNLTMEPADIERVMSLMGTEYHKLPSSDRAARELLGALRCKEALSSDPWYAKKAALTAELTGNEMAYWQNFWSSHVNTV
jgi:hypothetical protein